MHDIITSEEGCIQGDVPATALYGLGMKTLIDNLAEAIDVQKCIQSWFADDSSAAGKLEEMKKWWDILCAMGPKYGYFPLATKTILIVKEDQEEKAREVFGQTGISITTEGERHLGAVIGSEEYKQKFVENKISKWVNDVETLAEIAQDEPQSVYSCFTKAIIHRWTYIQRTIPNISHLFAPLETAIREKLVPALIGRNVSDIERRIIALPVKLGGLGIADPTQTADDQFQASVTITENLADIICRQEKDLSDS